MEMKYVVPDMAQSFGTLEFERNSQNKKSQSKNLSNIERNDHVFDRDKLLNLT